MEIWDLYDEARMLLPRKQVRGEPMAPGTYHLVVEIWTANPRGEVLLTLRSPDKQEYPNFWENTAGSALSGEVSRQAAVRELREETGLAAAEGELVSLGGRREDTAFVDAFFHLQKEFPCTLTLQEGETADAVWVSLARLDEMIAKGMVAAPVVERLIPLRQRLEAQMRRFQSR